MYGWPQCCADKQLLTTWCIYRCKIPTRDPHGHIIRLARAADVRRKLVYLASAFQRKCAQVLADAIVEFGKPERGDNYSMTILCLIGFDMFLIKEGEHASDV